jgi:S-DNA-T family DNA segregation ATPase FtsK/SpoIIIE
MSRAASASTWVRPTGSLSTTRVAQRHTARAVSQCRGMKFRVRVVAPRPSTDAGATPRGHLVDVLLDVPAGTVISSVADQLRAAVGEVGELFHGGRALCETTRLGEPPLVDGAIITVGHPGATRHQQGAVQLRVESGPDAGGLHWLEPGRYYVGRALGADIRIDDPDMSRSHACIDLDWDGATIRDLQSTNGTFVDGSAVGTEPAGLPFGAQLRVGSSTLTVAAPQTASAPLRPDGKGCLEFNRPPRIQPSASSVEVDFPTAPARRERLRFPVIAIVFPLIAAAAIVAFTKQPTFLLLGLLSPLMLIAQWTADRTSSAKSARLAQADYAARLAKAEERVCRAVVEEAQALRRHRPNAAEVASIVFSPTIRLWERRPQDDDFLLVRLGTGSLPASVRIRTPSSAGQQAVASPLLQNVPVAISLSEVGVLGIAGHRESVMGLARFIVGQLSVLHSPRHLRIVLLSAHDVETTVRTWEWIGWLPHVKPSKEQCQALLGVTRDQMAARASELLALLDAREAGGLPDETVRTVVLLDGARELRKHAGVARLLADGPRCGISLICLEDDPVALPAECDGRTVISPEHPTEMRVDVAGGVPVAHASLDAVSTRWAHDIAHRLAPLRDATPCMNADGVPQIARWLDVFVGRPNAPAPTPADIANGWRRTKRSTEVLLGLASCGPFTVDISRDGPHILVAGTTGSGKSELLQTLVCALAVSNSPDAMSLVLIDYKGGAAFADCARLPHTVAMVTDLDEHLTQRALISLKAELTRRERLFAEAGVTHIDDYRTSPLAATSPVARLAIVIDEFAALAEELPGFMRGLVAVAMRGRSLGVHLVLATQRPARAVSADIRANVGLSIALRVADVADSVDVIGTKDAVAIDHRTPGRAYARRGGAPLVAFQAARITGHATVHQPLSVRCLPFATLGDRPLPQPHDEDTPVSDLELIAEAVCTAAIDAGISPTRRPWLPPLPTRITVQELAQYPATRGANCLPYGLLDAPDAQTQRVLTLDLDAGRHLLVAGAPRSGRSTVLRTIAVGAMTGAADVHIYGIDCGSGALLPLQRLPQCGAIATADQADRVTRLVDRLEREVRRRSRLLTASGFSDVTEQRNHVAAADRIPYLLLLLDRWEGFLATLDDVDGGRLTSALIALLREGPAAGLRGVVTADRSGLVGRIASVIEDKIILRLDRTDVGLAGLSPNHVPSDLPPGRGFQAGTGLAVQLALPVPETSGPEHVAAIRRLAAASAPDSSACHPFRVEELPAAVPYEAVVRPFDAGPLWIAAGIGGDESITQGIDLAVDGPSFVVSGPARSGRSMALMAMAMSLIAGGSNVVVLTPRISPLRQLAKTGRVLGCVSVDDPAVYTVLTDVNGPLAVIVDDAELVTESPVGALLERYLQDARDRERAMLIGGTTSELLRQFRGFAAEGRKGKTGLLLSPESTLDGDVLGARLPRSGVGHGRQGRGVLVVRGALTPVQVPLVPL